MIYKNRWLLLIIFMTGLVILMIPDQAPPVIQLNKQHGPSLPDLAGLSLMLISWLLGTVFVAGNWTELRKKFGNPAILIMMGVYILSIAGIIAGLSLSIEWILWTAVMCAAIINFLLIKTAFSVAIKKY